MDAAERRGIIERARHRCEYCRLGEVHQPAVPFHIEHIIARQHGGDDSIEDLALACHPCNLQKGPNLASLDPETGELIRLFHPRRDHWSDHFLRPNSNWQSYRCLAAHECTAARSPAAAIDRHRIVGGIT